MAGLGAGLAAFLVLAIIGVIGADGAAIPLIFVVGWIFVLAFAGTIAGG